MLEVNKWWQKITPQQWKQLKEESDSERVIHFTKDQVEKLSIFFRALSSNHGYHIKFRFTKEHKTATSFHTLKYSKESYDRFKKRFNYLLTTKDSFIIFSRGPSGYSEYIALEYLICSDDYFVLRVYGLGNQHPDWNPYIKKTKRFLSLDDTYKCDGFKGFLKCLQELSSYLEQ